MTPEDFVHWLRGYLSVSGSLSTDALKDVREKLSQVSDRGKLCPDCGVPPETTHLGGCDVAHCTVCSRQCLTCECEGEHSDVWTGEFPGVVECRIRGWYCQDGFGSHPQFGSFCPCPQDAPGAMEDLNRLAYFKSRGKDEKYTGCTREYRKE